MIYTANNTWYFEHTFDNKIYCLEIFYPNNRYKLAIGNLDGESPTESEGKVTELLEDIRGMNPKPEYTHWLEHSISYKDWSTSFNSYDTMDKIFFGSKQCCWVKSNVRTGLLELAFPPMMLVSPRQNLSENFAQIHSIKQGRLFDLVTTFLNNKCLNENADHAHVHAYYEGELTKFQIDDFEIGINYNEETDVVSLYLGGYIESTTANTVFNEVWEISTIDGGRFKKEFRETLARRGFGGIWEAP
jgi:hypothetical protein